MSADGESAPKLAIGITFGNSYSSIAWTASNGQTEVIANEDGDRQIPSALAYVGGEEFVGNQAKSQLVRNAKNTVAYFRDFIGKECVNPCKCCLTFLYLKERKRNKARNGRLIYVSALAASSR